MLSFCLFFVMRNIPLTDKQVTPRSLKWYEENDFSKLYKKRAWLFQTSAYGKWKIS